MGFTLFSDESRDRQNELWAELRDEGPAVPSDDGFLVVTRHDDVREVLHSPDRFSSRPNQGEALGLSMEIAPDADPEFLAAVMALAAELPLDLEELMSTSFLAAADEPEHGVMRRIVNRGFTPRRLASWDDRITALTDRLVSSLNPEEPWDLVERLAVPLPVEVISDILAVDDAHRADVKRWSDIVVTMAQGAERNSDHAKLAILGIVKEFADYFVPVIEHRRDQGGDDLISDLVHAEQDETLTAVGTVLFIFLLLVAGNETTTNLIGNLVVSLLENPEQLALLSAEPGLMSNAIDETLRHRSPVQFVFRAPIGDQQVGGITVPDGATMALVVASANRDPDRFSDPDRFDIRRADASQHLALGHGIHYCLGAHLGRREATAAVGALLPHLTGRTLDDAGLDRLPSVMVHGYQQIDLRPN